MWAILGHLGSECECDGKHSHYKYLPPISKSWIKLLSITGEENFCTGCTHSGIVVFQAVNGDLLNKTVKEFYTFII